MPHNKWPALTLVLVFKFSQYFVLPHLSDYLFHHSYLHLNLSAFSLIFLSYCHRLLFSRLSRSILAVFCSAVSPISSGVWQIVGSILEICPKIWPVVRGVAENGVAFPTKCHCRYETLVIELKESITLWQRLTYWHTHSLCRCLSGVLCSVAMFFFLLQHYSALWKSGLLY